MYEAQVGSWTEQRVAIQKLAAVATLGIGYICTRRGEGHLLCIFRKVGMFVIGEDSVRT